MPRTIKVFPEGIKTLHERSANKIAKVLANLLRLYPNATKVKYIRGSHFKITDGDGNI